MPPRSKVGAVRGEGCEEEKQEGVGVGRRRVGGGVRPVRVSNLYYNHSSGCGGVSNFTPTGCQVLPGAEVLQPRRPTR
eukprot:745758-Hanusia_phi.AAC.4